MIKMLNLISTMGYRRKRQKEMRRERRISFEKNEFWLMASLLTVLRFY